MSCSTCPRRQALPPMSETERYLLQRLGELAYLPVCRYLIRNPENPDLSFVMAAPVYLEEPCADAQTVKDFGDALLMLEKRHFITLDYGLTISGGSYDLFRSSRHYQNFAWSVTAPSAEPFLEEGSVCLTVQGQEALDEADL